jgi:hypothetical protein
MRRVRFLRFDSLESRELLSRAHGALGHAARAHAQARPAAAAPLTLSGTLTVVGRAGTTSPNLDGGYTTSMPVKGQLDGLGAVHGVWSESTDSLGNYLGPDTVTLRDAQGAVTVAFSDAMPGPAHSSGPHAVYYQHAQHVLGGSGAYAGAVESGTIDLNMNAAHTTVVSMTLNTSGS